MARAVGSDPAAWPTSPFGRTAVRLGEPLSALIVAGEHVCSGTGRENALLRGEAASLARSVGPLRAYEALGIGYQRTPREARSRSAATSSTMPVRSAPSTTSRVGPRSSSRVSPPMVVPYRDVAFTLEEATTVGQDVVLEVEPLGDPPTVLFDRVMRRDALFAICGPLPDDEPLSRRPTADVPLFVGPATLSLSGGRGVYRWDEIHFGAHEVRVKGSVTAGQDALFDATGGPRGGRSS